MMTKKLYDQDAYATVFSAKVVSCEQIKKEYEVILDQTLFFPEEGGQSADQGTIDDLEVLDVQIKDDIITHRLKKPLAVGMDVSGKIDWQHRFYNMQQHSGEHIFSGLVYRNHGYHNVGFHLSDQIVTMDFDGVLTEEQIREIEWKVNEAIVQNLESEVTFPTKEELSHMDYRSKIDIPGQVRIVTFPGYDVCACCAPHVKRTGEIGMLKVIGTQNHKGGVRVRILCGFRALADYRQKNDSVTAISNKLSAKTEEVTEAVERVQAEANDYKQELIALKREILLGKLEQLPKDAVNVCLFTGDADQILMREIVNGLTETHDGYCGVFAGDDQKGYRYIIGTAKRDAREMGQKLREVFSAKGGGSQEMIQGALQGEQSAIEKVFQE